MKKSKKIGLSLNKKVVSSFNTENLRGGSDGFTGTGISLKGGCGTGQPVPTGGSRCCYL